MDPAMMMQGHVMRSPRAVRTDLGARPGSMIEETKTNAVLRTDAEPDDELACGVSKTQTQSSLMIRRDFNLAPLRAKQAN